MDEERKEERKNEYGFCPKCGAVMQNGQCQSCGYGKRMKTDIPEGRKKTGMSTGAKIILAICILLIVFVVGLVGTIAFITVKSLSSITWQPELIQDFDDLYDYGSSYETYTPDEDDEFYKELTDATTDGLSYQVEWHQETAYPDDADETAYLSLYYPTFTGDDQEFFSTLNEKVDEMVHRYENSYTEQKVVVNTVVYVTLMEEDRLSLVCKYDVSGKDSYYGLDTLNMDMAAEKEIPNDQLLDVDDTLVTRFRAQNSKQNGSTPWLDKLSDEELLQDLSDDGKRVVFLTPVGTEVGFNDEKNGWVTVTFKENTI